MRAVFLGIIMLATAAGIRGQEDGKGARLVQTPCEKMAWKLTLTEPPVAEQPTASQSVNVNGVQSISISKNGVVSKVVIREKTKLLSEIWRIGNCSLYLISSRNKVVPIQDNPELPPYPYASSGFYGIEHVNPADEQKAVAYDKSMCRYFRGILPKGKGFLGDTSDAGSPGVYEAWFDQKTGLPKAYRESGITFTYEFEATPEGVRLPPEYLEAITKHLDNLVHAGLLTPADQTKIHETIGR